MQHLKKIKGFFFECWSFERLLLLISLLGTTGVLVWLLCYSHYGFDFTDEGFYLAWISNPFLYDWSVTQFGFIYHPLYKVLNGNIAWLRQANILITFALAFSMFCGFLTKHVPDGTSGRFPRMVISAGLATASLLLLSTGWLPTPNYNSLAVQALLICATGLVLADRTRSRSSFIGWILIAVGGWLAFMAKPSTAMFLAVAVAAYVVLAFKVNLRFWALSLAVLVGLLLASAFMIDGSLEKFYERIRTGIIFAGYLGGGHTYESIMRWDEFHLTDAESRVMLWITALVFGLSAMYAWLMRVRLSAYSVGLILVLFLLVGIGIVEQLIRFDNPDSFRGLLIWAVPFAAVLSGLVWSRQRLIFAMPWSNWVLAAVLLALPHAYAFGTLANYWKTGSMTAAFWILAGLIFTIPYLRARESVAILLPLVFGIQLITTTFLQKSMDTPYRQVQPLRLNESSVLVGRSSNLVLSEEYASYLDVARKAAKENGLASGSPIIDLTGQSPGLLYAMGAVNLGQPWTIGGYPGSVQLAKAALQRVSCHDIAKAWLLVEPEGPRKIPFEVIDSVGFDAAGDYKEVASWKTARGVGGYEEQRDQYLLKPVLAPEIAVENCNAKRTGFQN